MRARSRRWPARGSPLSDESHAHLGYQRPFQPFLGLQPPTDDGPDRLLDSGPLYAGANVGRIADIRPAAELVAGRRP